MRKLARPLRLQPFRRLLAAYAINAIGGWAGEIALAVLVLERTGSAAGVGAVLLAGQLLPALPAPWLTDRAGRLPAGRGLVLLLWLQGGIFAALALSASSRFSLPATLAMIALDGAAAIAARALLKAAACAVTAPAGLLREGNALLTNVFTMSVAGGPLLGGALVA